MFLKEKRKTERSKNVKRIEGLSIIWLVLILKIHRIRILRAPMIRNGNYPRDTGKNTRIRILFYPLFGAGF
jgi:hypothetical protein